MKLVSCTVGMYIYCVGDHDIGDYTEGPSSHLPILYLPSKGGQLPPPPRTGHIQVLYCTVRFSMYVHVYVHVMLCNLFQCVCPSF